MSTSELHDIETRIGQLTPAEKQILLDWLARDLRVASSAYRRAALAAMAADAEIQREIRAIEMEFAEAAEDGLRMSTARIHNGTALKDQPTRCGG